MKIVTWFFSLTLLLNASSLEWQENYSIALKKAQVENKALLVLITSETCKWCRRLESTTLEDEAVMRKLAQDFIVVNVTRDKSVYPKYLKAPMVPYSYFLNTQERVLVKMPGHWSVEDYLSIIDDAKRKIK